MSEFDFWNDANVDITMVSCFLYCRDAPVCVKERRVAMELRRQTWALPPRQLESNLVAKLEQAVAPLTMLPPVIASNTNPQHVVPGYRLLDWSVSEFEPGFFVNFGNYKAADGQEALSGPSA